MDSNHRSRKTADLQSAPFGHSGISQLLPPVFGCTISIHALREEGDPGNVPCRRWRSIYFYPRPPRGGRRNFRQTATAKPTISIHALREEGDPALPVLLRCHTISIHALREEGDRTRRQMVSGSSNFYPRPPRGGRPGLGDKWFQDHQISIHALREEGDHSPASSAPMALYFYPRPPRGGRPGCTTADGNAEVISIHALREEGDFP